MTSDQEKRRGDLRRKTLKSGKIIFNDGQSVMNCVVKDLSPTGARLEAESLVDCPRSFTLALASGPIYESEVRWMKFMAAGVRFLRVKEDPD